MAGISSVSYEPHLCPPPHGNPLTSSCPAGAFPSWRPDLCPLLLSISMLGTLSSPPQHIAVIPRGSNVQGHDTPALCCILFPDSPQTPISTDGLISAWASFLLCPSLHTHPSPLPTRSYLNIFLHPSAMLTVPFHMLSLHQALEAASNAPASSAPFSMPQPQ